MTAYTKQTWVNGAAGGTPVSAGRLSHMEDGIADPASSISSGIFAKEQAIGRRQPNVYQRYAGITNGTYANGTVDESGHTLVVNGQTPAILSGKKRNPTPVSGATYDSKVLDSAFGSIAVDFTLEASGTLGTQSITLITNVNSGALLHDFIHLTVSPASGWGLSYCVGTYTGSLTALASGPWASAALSGRYRMELAVDGDLIYVRGPDGDITAVSNATAAALAGPRCTWELAWTSGDAEPRIIAESAAVYDNTAVMAPPRDVFGVSRWIAGHSGIGDLDNLTAQKGTANEVAIGRSAGLGVPSIRLGIGGPEIYGSGAFAASANLLVAPGTTQVLLDSTGIRFSDFYDTNLYRSAADTLATDDDFACLTVGKGIILKSPNGTQYRLTVANGGALSAVAV